MAQHAGAVPCAGCSCSRANFLSTPAAQVVEVIDPAKRDFRLLDLLQKYHSSRKNRVIIFVLYKKEAPRVESLLQRKGWSAAAIHGDISQVQRSKAVEQFKSGQVPLLIATDVAARGLDIPDVEVVINYSFPLTTEDYVHRIGRTGRAGKTGACRVGAPVPALARIAGCALNGCLLPSCSMLLMAAWCLLLRRCGAHVFPGRSGQAPCWRADQRAARGQAGGASGAAGLWHHCQEEGEQAVRRPLQGCGPQR